MADPNIEALQQRVATLEAQVATLMQAISADRGGNVVIRAQNSLTLNGGTNIVLNAGYAMTMTAGFDLTMTGQHDLKLTAGNCATMVVGNRLRVRSHEASFETTGSFSVSAAVGCDINSRQNLAITAGKEMAMSAGAGMTVSVGKTLAITAADSAAMATGGASLAMKKDGSVDLRGRDVSIIASGKINAKASSDVVMRGSKIRQN
ncbi:hypothetical protein [Bosea sp. (in: a-proteobacteria)]|jgi:type VI secretion system secreted protein VgrG|uniref:hypothetical protein n=1 Tax=Bosea sp. (in: a-proteobacteria) TaxID=1871050 RepID=UPI002734D32E|nr:hypothetical protein [Bosea sp. (in: a-proteobacteria)]MDP3410319.1 hypothetical protein [Bosea sp. (in: a-proteobacteria)]